MQFGAPPCSSRGVFRLLVPLTALAAGLLFATSAATAHGTDLRAGRRQQLADLVSAERAKEVSLDAAAARLRAQVAALTAAAERRDSRVAAASAAAAVRAAAGLTPVSGRGLEVTLHDAARRVPPASSNPDDLVVHQQDLEAVVNGLWAGGATALSLMGQRVVSTSAVRCVGNTVILHGRVYGPPFVVRAVGDPTRLRAGLDAEPGVQYFETFVARFGLGFLVRTVPRLSLPAYDGTVDLPHVVLS